MLTIIAIVLIAAAVILFVFTVTSTVKEYKRKKNGLESDFGLYIFYTACTLVAISLPVVLLFGVQE